MNRARREGEVRLGTAREGERAKEKFTVNVNFCFEGQGLNQRPTRQQHARLNTRTRNESKESKKAKDPFPLSIAITGIKRRLPTRLRITPHTRGSRESGFVLAIRGSVKGEGVFAFVAVQRVWGVCARWVPSNRARGEGRARGRPTGLTGNRQATRH